MTYNKQLCYNYINCVGVSVLVLVMPLQTQEQCDKCNIYICTKDNNPILESRPYPVRPCRQYRSPLWISEPSC